MSPDATLSVDLRRWQGAVQKMSNLVSDSAPAVLKASVRRFVTQAVRWTPPYYVKPGVNPETGKKTGMHNIAAEFAAIGETPNDYRIGERAVIRGMFNIFVPMSRDWLEAVVREHGNPIQDVWVKWGESRRHLVNATAIFNINDARTYLNERWKNSPPKKANLNRMEIGGPDVRLLPWDVFFLFQQREVAQLGHMKAGWIASMDEIGIKSVPAWIRRWKGKSQIGRVIDNQLANKTAPSIAIANTAKGISRVEKDIHENALRYAISNMEADIDRMIRYGVGKSGVFRMKGA